MLKSDTLSRVLYVDLGKKSFRIENRADLFEKYIGGTGVATKLLAEECPPGADPFSPESPIIFAVGPLNGAFPLAAKTVAMFKSPLTGNLGEAHCGGRTAVAIRMAGFGAIVIKGKSDIPIYISITDGKVFFRNAQTLWGMKSSFTVGKVIREKETGPGQRTIMRIGLAGENLVSYASVTAETYRHFGRLGLGAIFGSKYLKAIAISGKRSFDVIDKKGYRKIYDEIYDQAVNMPVMKKYHDLGTAENIMKLSKAGALPIKNLTDTKLEGVENVSGESLAQFHLSRRVACAHCPVACIHLATLKEPYEDEPYFFKTTSVGYDFELIYSLGTMLGITEPANLLKLIDCVEDYAMDAMSAGVVLAWATEMFEKKKITEIETDGINPGWGQVEQYLEMVPKIVKQPNDFYKALAQGIDYASSLYGGREFALAFGKNEMPGYHTGPAAYLGFLLGTRHSHLDNAGYSIDQGDLLKQKVTPQQVVDKLFEEEGFRQILSSIVICFFARGIYKPELVAETLNVLGFKYSLDDLKRIGKEIHLEKYRFKIREGFDFDKMHVPDRIFQTPEPTGQISREFIDEGLKYAKSLIMADV